MIERRAPDGRRISEEEYRELHKEKLVRIISSRGRNSYLDWLISGEQVEVFDPVAAIAVFPSFSSEGLKLELEFLARNDASGDAKDYLRRVSALTLPEVIAGDARLFTSSSEMMQVLARTNMPLGLIAFSKNPNLPEESAYLFSHMLFAPAQSFSQIQTSVSQELLLPKYQNINPRP